MGRHGPLAECWCCGRPGRHAGRGLCERCWHRWWQRGFSGPGPGPEFQPLAAKAREYAHVITVLSLRDASKKIGVSARTVSRWRAALRRDAYDGSDLFEEVAS